MGGLTEWASTICLLHWVVGNASDIRMILDQWKESQVHLSRDAHIIDTVLLHASKHIRIPVDCQLPVLLGQLPLLDPGEGFAEGLEPVTGHRQVIPGDAPCINCGYGSRRTDAVLKASCIQKAQIESISVMVHEHISAIDQIPYTLDNLPVIYI